jgi:hypothetical protein
MSTVTPGERLERRFGFEDASFEYYMSRYHATSVTATRLERLGEAMSEHGHPLVRYAGAWAFAERALYGTGELPIADRLDSLDMAYELWGDAASGFGSLGSLCRDTERAAEVWALGMRALQAQAYQPAMKLVAQLRGGEAVAEEQAYAAALKARANVSNLGAYILGQRNLRDGFSYERYRAGIRNELVAGLLPQYTQPLSHFIIAASVRQDNHRNESFRADLLAISAQAPYSATPIAVSGRQRLIGEHRCKIYADELILAPQKKVWDTLRVLGDVENGQPINPEEQSQLDQLVDNMGTRLRAIPRNKV